MATSSAAEGDRRRRGRPPKSPEPSRSARSRLGRALREAREAEGIALSQFAEQTTYSEGHLSNVEHGMAAPSPELVDVYESRLRGNGLFRSLYALVVDEQRELRQQRRGGKSPLPDTAAGRATRPGDRSQFVADLTLPDGSPVPPGARLEKRWRLRNVGTVPWRGRSLERDDVVIGLELESLGIELISATEHFDDTPFGKRMRRYLAADAEFYSEELSQKAKGGLHKKASHGGTPGPAPLGYLNVRRHVDDIPVTLVEPDPDRAQHIEWAFAAYATGGYTLATLCAALARRGLVKRKTRKYAATPISRSHLARILANPYYSGTVRYGGVEYEGKHDPLIDLQTFDRVQEILKAHNNAGEKSWKHHHYLKGSLVCANCGSRLTFVKARGKGGTYHYFACIGRIKGTGCDLPYLAAGEIEDRVAAAYDTLRLKQLGTADHTAWTAHLDDVRVALDIAIAGMRRQHARATKQQRARIATIKAQQTKLLDAFLDDSLPRELLSRKQAALSVELSQAEAALAVAEQDADELDNIVQAVLDMAGNLEETYTAADDQTRRLLNQAFFKAFEISADDIDIELDEFVSEVTAKDTPRRLKAETRRRVSAAAGSNVTLLAEREGFEPPRPLRA